MRNSVSWNSPAYLSDDGIYRTWLMRPTGHRGSGHCTFVMLNPSTADHRLDDPTIRRCRGFACILQCNSFGVINLFSMRAPKPSQLWSDVARDPVGPDNFDAWSLIQKSYNQDDGDRIIVAWGALPGGAPSWFRVLWRDQITSLCQHFKFSDLECLAVTKNGQPRHPLYLSNSCRPTPWFINLT